MGKILNPMLMRLHIYIRILWSALEPEEGNGFEFSNVFTLCSEQDLVLQAEEVDDGRWLTPAEQPLNSSIVA